MNLLISAFTAIANVFLGAVVFWKNPKSETNKLFCFLTFTIAIWAITNYISLQYSDPLNTLFWIRIIMAVALTMFVLLYLLSVAFPFKKSPIKPKHFQLIIIDLIIMQCLSVTTLVFQSAQVSASGSITPLPGPLMPLYGFHILSYLIGTLVTLLKKRRTFSGSTRSQVNLMLLGISLTFILATISNFLLVVILKFTQFVVFGPAISLILVCTIAYAIIKHKFLDISQLILRTISFTVVSLIIILIYATILFRALQYIPANLHNTASILIALILAYSYNPIHHAIERITQNIFFRQPYSPENLLERLGELLRSTLSLHTLLRGVVSELQVSIQASSAWFVITSDKDNISPAIGYGKKIVLTPNTIFNLKKISQSSSLIIFDELEEGAQKDLLRQLDISILIPLKVKEKFLGFLLLGNKSSGNIFSIQDVDVLEILSPQLSIAIQNAKSYEEISRFNVTLKEEVDKATTDLKKANRDLKHLDKLKDEFVFIATHELKNPVTAMRGYLSMFKEEAFGTIPEKMKEPMNQLQASNQQLVELVNDLLQIARSEANTLQVHTEPTNICPLIDSVKESLKPLSDQKKLTVVHACPNAMPQAQADAQRVKEIMNNLISNAIKYSDQGTITISHEVKTDKIITHVKDQGVGISKEDQQKLFTRFFRVEEEAAKGIPGTGLGLFIVKQLIEKMGGTIWLDTEKGKGSTFSFSLPTA